MFKEWLEEAPEEDRMRYPDEEGQEVYCLARSLLGNWRCTRPTGHDGECRAYGPEGELYAVWEERCTSRW